MRPTHHAHEQYENEPVMEDMPDMLNKDFDFIYHEKKNVQGKENMLFFSI